MRIRKLLSRLLQRRSASGGNVHQQKLTADEIPVPVLVSPGRSTTLRPGESHLAAMERLMRGEDL